ncbi:hypothetical protein MRB53_039496 [Persea americana]|nr:hypothetical protein MRB53_039496 [Persea americana]
MLTRFKQRDRTSRLSKKQSQSMASLSLDPALLTAKLEVARLEQNSKHTSHRTSSGRDEPARSSSQRQHKSSTRKSLPIEAEYTADGKPVYNTAQILAALELNARRSSSLTRHGHSTDVVRDRRSEELVRSDSKRESTEKDGIPERESRHEKRHDQGTDNRQPIIGRRRFAHAPGTVQLVPVKHGSQTMYERIEIPESTLLEDTDPDLVADGTGELQRPKLSKYDRPHWAQQSQNASNMGLLKQSLSMKEKKPRPKSYLPPLQQQDHKVIVRRSSVGSKGAADITGTLIADAVNQIKKEERLRKWQSVQNFLKPSCS